MKGGKRIICTIAMSFSFFLETSPDQEREFLQWAEKRYKKTQTEEVKNMKIEEKKCSMDTFVEDEIHVGFPKILCFVSFSMPIESLAELSREIQRVGGVFIIRGLPKDSFAMFSNKLVELRKNGIYIPILIDPKAFMHYGVDHVPTFVVFNENHYDKLAGNVSVDHVLTKFIAGGDTSYESTSLKEKRF